MISSSTSSTSSTTSSTTTSAASTSTRRTAASFACSPACASLSTWLPDCAASASQHASFTAARDVSDGGRGDRGTGQSGIRTERRRLQKAGSLTAARVRRAAGQRPAALLRVEPAGDEARAADAQRRGGERHGRARRRRRGGGGRVPAARAPMDEPAETHRAGYWRFVWCLYVAMDSPRRLDR